MSGNWGSRLRQTVNLVVITLEVLVLKASVQGRGPYPKRLERRWRRGEVMLYVLRENIHIRVNPSTGIFTAPLSRALTVRHCCTPKTLLNECDM
jgi:hypothetical protein